MFEKKVKLYETHQKLLEWCVNNGDDELQNIINELHGQIQTLDEPPPGDPPGGNNPPKKPPVP